MELYILRHGEADPRDSGVADVDRALTRRGKADTRESLRMAQRAKMAPQVILTSPLRRARETAAIGAKLFPSARLVASDRLKPNADVASIWKEVGLMAAAEQIMLVGHEPHLSHLVAFLLEAPVMIDLKKSGLMRIDCPERTGGPRGVLKWMLTPKLARSL